MELFRRLKTEAGNNAAFRGHILGNFAQGHIYGRGKVAIAECRNCGLKVCVYTNPPPNQERMDGRALKTDCKGHKGEPS